MENLNPAKQKEFTKTLQLSAQSLMDLINDLLDITKLESETVELEQIVFNLAELVEEIISIMSVKAKEKGIELYIKYDKKLNESFIGDPLRIRQILMNLISNAVKFTEIGTVSVHIEACKHQKTGLTSVCIDIIDTGIGIAPGKVETIFSKFSQADTSITRKFGGTGLGLSICKTLIDLMGGHISVVSSLGLGSKFSLEIPLLPAEGNMSRKERAFTAGGIDADISIAQQQIRILLVEDYKANILVATATIEECGFRWELAETGKEALDKFKSSKYDLILMDVQMPELDGISATKAIREFEKLHLRTPTPILGITAFSQEKDRDQCIAAGMNDYLSKPFNPQSLKEKMRLLLNSHEGDFI
jgi:CheY-like chemotaxis protein